MVITQREKEEKLYADYKELTAKGLMATQAVRALMVKYSYGYEPSVWTVIRRCRRRLEAEGKEA